MILPEVNYSGDGDSLYQEERRQMNVIVMGYFFIVFHKSNDLLTSSILVNQLLVITPSN